MKEGLALILALALPAFVSAGCALDTYGEACENCFSNVTGPVLQQECFQAMGASAMFCYSEQYPMMAAASANGSCPELDMCFADATACLVSSGVAGAGDVCMNSNSASCMSELDSCSARANASCAPRGEKVIAEEVRKGVVGVCPCLGWLPVAVGAVLLCGIWRSGTALF